MFDKKADVDRHVENCLKKTNSERERNLRSIAFAKLYYNIGEMELARRYISMYLSVKPTSAEAHQLLGKILEKLGRRDAALEEYRISLDLDSKQSGLILKVCELLAQDDVVLEPTRARYWCEQAQLLDPQSEAVFNLKERLISNESNNPRDLHKLFLTELEHRPTDVPLRVRLLNHLLQNNQVTEAYKHVAEIEEKNLSIFTHHFAWYETLTKVLVRYKNENLNGNVLKWDFWVLIVTVLDKLATLCMDENSASIKQLSECVSNVFNLDQMLFTASENATDNSSERQLSQEFFLHYKAQLCFHLCCILFKQAKKDQLTYKEAVNLTLPLLLICYHSQPADLQSVWLEHATEKVREQVHRWHREASYRCSQAGHILLTLVKGRRSHFVDRVSQLCSGSWREKTFKNIFITRDQQLRIKSSSFVSSTDEVAIKLPDTSDLFRYDETAQLVYPHSLHHVLWIGLNNQPAKFRCTIFDGLQFSVKNLNNCAAETLNILDIQAFIYCCIFCAQSQIEDSKQLIYYNQEKPNVLPMCITEPLGTLSQNKWFACAYKMFRNETGSDISDLRVTLIKGIEIVRCVGSHGLDVKLLVLLANTFAQRAKLLTKWTEIEQTELRAELYWKAALPLLEKLRNNQAITYPVKRWFEYRTKEISPTEIAMHIEDGKLFSAVQLMKKKSYEKALQMLENLRNPYASFYQAQIYKLLADEQVSHNKENVTSEMRSQHIILLSRARDCLYLTLDRLREPSVDRKHPLNAQLGTEIEKIERLLSRIDPDICGNRNDCDALSDENVSSVGSVGDHTNVNSTYFGHSLFNGNVTPRHETTFSTPYFNMDTLNLSRRVEARPSPERLDAQLRQMAANKDAAVAHMVEQNKIMVDSHRNLVDELKNFKDIVTGFTSSVNNELKGIKKTVQDLKEAVDELQNLKEAVEQVYEIKKDLAELRKDTNKLKSNQINDEDLYALEDEYAVDYNIASNTTGFNSAAFYSQFPQRLQGANALAYGAPGLYGMYPMYPYGGLGLGQPGSLPFPEGQLPDFRAMGSIAQGLSQAGLTQSQVTLTQPGLPMFTKFDSTALPSFTTTQSQILPPRSVMSQPILPTAYAMPNQLATSLASMPTATSAVSAVTTVTSSLPVNVVITASDPLPTTSASQPILSVTIPPQHLKGNQQSKKQPHNYQIPLPVITQPTFSTVSASISSVPMPVSTQNLLSNVAPPVFSSLSVQSPTHQPSKTQHNAQVDKSGQKLNVSQKSDDSKFNQNDSHVSEPSVPEEHDPCPDFKPIIPLPDEISVTTGEENEIVLFCERAKLYRYVDKEWKERGIGNMKILHDKEGGSVRILMRREIILKICANHILTPEMVLTPMQNSDRAYIWAANDYADEIYVLEKFCIKFKSSEIGLKFFECFNHAKTLIKADNKKDLDKKNENVNKNKTNDKEIQEHLKNRDALSAPKIETPKGSDTPKESQPVASLGGFMFTSTPTFKPKTDIKESVEKTQSVPTSKPHPFASFSFESKTQNAPKSDKSSSEFKPVQKQTAEFIAKESASPKPVCKVVTVSDSTSENDDFVPTAEFKPVIPLPELIEVKTGEENSVALFEVKAKLLRFDSDSKEWKERGVGIMKVLKEKTIRLVMRREQIHKVCCNHQLLKSMVFTNMPKNNRVLNWCAQDFSENILKTEMFAIKFKTAELCEEFLKAIHEAQSMLDSSNYVIESTTVTPFKPLETHMKDSTWECMSCHKYNELKHEKCCMCGTLKDSKSDQAQSPQKFKPSASPQPAPSWGDKSKQKGSTWECKTCFMHNDGKKNYCEACDTPKNDSIPIKDVSVDKNASGDQFSFGISTSFNTPNSSLNNTSYSFGQKTPTSNNSSNWDSFKIHKAKVNTWTCNTCNVSYDNTVGQCIACNASKEAVDDKNTVVSGWGDKFKPVEGSWTCKACYVNNKPETTSCISCSTPKDGAEKTQPSGFMTVTSSSSAATSTFTFGIKPTTTNAGSGWGDEFKPKEGSWYCKACYVSNAGDVLYCVACNEPKDDTVPKKPQGIDLTSNTESKFIFGQPFAANQPIFGAKTTTAVGFSFGSSQTSFTFGMPQTKTVDQKTQNQNPPLDLAPKTSFNFSLNVTPIDKPKGDTLEPPKKEEFVFGSPNKYNFEFKPRSPRKQSCGDGDDSDGSVNEDDGDHIYFKPVIPLPEKIDVRTGEEDEEVCYCHRAKLFRFANGEWKERGIGDIKILKHRTTGKLRVVMRREQVLKICLNHALTNEIDYKSKDDRTWLFSSPDYSDGEINYQQFCIRFKNAEIATQFMNAVNKARGQISQVADKIEEDSQKTNDDDVIFVKEIKVTPEEEKKALELKLPKNFYAYLQKSPCKGCIGCNPDDYVFPTPKLLKPGSESITDKPKDIKNEKPFTTKTIFGKDVGTEKSKSVSSSVESKPTVSSVFPTATSVTSTPTTKTPFTFNFTKSEDNKTPIDTQTTQPRSPNKSPLLPAKFTTPTTNVNYIFGNTQPTTTNIFGNTSSTTTNIFGNKSSTTQNMFGTTVSTTSTTSSIFGKPSTTFGGSFTTSNIFSGTSSAGKTFGGPLSTGNIFGGTQSTTNNIFGGTSKMFATPQPNILDSPAQTSENKTTIQENNAQNTQELFKPPFPDSKSDNQTPGVFDNPSVFLTTKPESMVTSQHIFVSGQDVKPADSSTSKQTIFGNVSGQSFASIAQSASEDKKLSAPVLKCDSSLSFAALASEKNTFAVQDNSKPFMFEGAGTLVFANLSKNKEEQKKEETKEESKEEETENPHEGDEDNYDPHYEPIVPLPNAIVVKTGEEEEKVLFIERAKLFRFSTDSGAGEWKERGVGQLKLLHHPVKGTYRLLLRREQVHKLVLNHLITADLDLQPMKTSNSAWLWAGINHTEDGTQLEKLAVRFKNSDIAQTFYQEIQAALHDIRLNNSKQSVEEEDTEGGSGNEEYVSDESDESSSFLFYKRCTLSMRDENDWKILGMGDIKIYYDSDLFGSRIVVYGNTHEKISNTIIAANTKMELDDTCCIWSAMEWSLTPAVHRVLKARFSSSAAAQEMYYIFQESQQCAKKCGIVDDLPDEEED